MDEKQLNWYRITLAERDTEIAALKAELAEWQVKAGMWEHSYEEALKDVSYMEADIKELRAQVAELESWKAAVPVDAIERYFRDVLEVEEYAESRQDFAAIVAYLFPPVR